jgi:myo-inositol 2-dehydrogenase/D-chiro-inositol 1-dehydrogenase
MTDIADRPLGVGMLGAGPVTQAIHLPTLSTLYDRFRVVHVMDVNEAVAAAVAVRTGARSTTDAQVLLDDPAVDVVAICSPHQFHAEQVDAATKAGKRGILCEKPLATTVEQAQLIADVSASSGVPIVVGTMHSWDPAFVAAGAAWGGLPGEATFVRVKTYLPANEEMVDLSTDLAAPPPPLPPRGDLADPRTRAAMVRGGILGLATHNLPMVRQFAPSIDEVLSAGQVPPFGYELAFRSGETVAQVLALMPGRWPPEWSVHAFGPGSELHVTYPPSYVLAGSATATLETSTSSTCWRYPHNGYQAEWMHLADVVEGRAELAIPVQTAVDDLLFALQLADGADALILEER